MKKAEGIRRQASGKRLGAILKAPLLGGRASKNDPVDHFSEGARLQG
jgi:hypothetical protein